MDQPLKPVNVHLDRVTLEDIESHKDLSAEQIAHDLNNLLDYDASENRNNFFGNPTLYHYQFRNLLNCRRDKGKTIYDVWADPEARAKLIEYTRKKNRGGKTAAGNVFECFRINGGSIVMFKSTTAKYVYQKYGATKVLDPTAGWGGRMLGAWALDIDYTGIDTNTNMREAYTEMMDTLANHSSFGNQLFETESTSNLNMIWESAMDVDFSKLDYDFVLTSPPYSNLEIYEHMTPWATDTEFYQDFLIPLIEKCRTHIQPGGTVCFNISPKMYDDALELGLEPAHDEEDLKQQLGQQTGKKKQDKIYIWYDKRK